MDLMERLLTLGLANAAAAALLALVVACLSWVLARRPAWLHCLWLLVLLKLVTPPLCEIPILGRDSAPVAEEPVAIPSTEQVDLPDEAFVSVDANQDEVFDVANLEQKAQQEPFWSRWRRILLARLATVWMLGSLATLSLAGIRITRFHWLLRHARPAPDQVQEQAGELAGRLGLKRSPVVCWIDAPLMPMLWALGCRPRLIVPVKLWKSLNDRQQSLLLTHELAHLRRGDHLLRLLELVVTAFYWWLPVLWWARQALRDAEEQCCDAWVIWAFPDESRTYAETLLDTVDFLNPSRSAEPLLACGFGRAQQLRRRLTMIMLGTTPRRLGRGSALLAFGLSAALLPMTPSWAQKPEETKTVKAEAFTIEFTDDHSPKLTRDVKSEVRVVVATDGKVQEVKAGSMHKATELLKQRVEELAREGGDSKQHIAEIKALKQVLLDLEKANTKESVQYRWKLEDNPEQLGVLRVHAVDAKLAAEMKGKLSSAKARVAFLAKEVVQKQHQLQKAEQELKALAAQASTEAHAERRVVIRKVAPYRLNVVRTLPADTGTKISDHDRLESLEKKLDKLLNEVANLRKHEKNEQ